MSEVEMISAEIRALEDKKALIQGTIDNLRAKQRAIRTDKIFSEIDADIAEEAKRKTGECGAQT